MNPIVEHICAVSLSVTALGLLYSSTVMNNDFSDTSSVKKENILFEPVNPSISDVSSRNTREALSEGGGKRPRVYTTYEDRYETISDAGIIVWSWEGGATVKKEQLAKTIEAVQSRLSIVPKGSENHVALLLETSAVESSRGLIVKQVGGPARGIFQMEPRTEKCTRNWLKARFPKVYEEVMVFYDKNQSPEWNRTHNVPYNVAMSTAYYWRRLGDSLAKNITTLEDRAKVWKKHYNTYLGRGTIAGYIKKSLEYL